MSNRVPCFKCGLMLGPGEFCALEDCPAYETHEWVPPVKEVRTDPFEVPVGPQAPTVKPK